MEFSWPEALQNRRAALLEFVEQEINPLLRKQAEQGERTFPHDAWRTCAHADLHGMMVPQQYGGAGLSALDAVYLLEAFGYACIDNAFAYAVCAQTFSTQTLLVQHASDTQKAAWLPQIVSGEKITAFAISEALAGSDAFALDTTAQAGDGTYTLNGEKRYITLAPVADLLVVFAKTQPERGAWGVSVFMVDLHDSCVDTSVTTGKLGLRTVPMGDVRLHDCVVSADQRIGREGAGLAMFGKTMEAERAYILCSQIGALARHLEQAVAYAKQRKQSGKPISKYQVVADRLVDVKLRLETSQLLLYKVAWLDTAGRNVQMASALANLHASESLLASSIDTFRNAGVRGYIGEDDSGMNVLDSLGAIIYSGTSDIQKAVIAKSLGL